MKVIVMTGATSDIGAEALKPKSLNSLIAIIISQKRPSGGHHFTNYLNKQVLLFMLNFRANSSLDTTYSILATGSG